LFRVSHFPVSTDILTNTCLIGKKYFYVVVLQISLFYCKDACSKFFISNCVRQNVNGKNKVYSRRGHVGPEGE